jgi:hypothetical protein
MPRTRLRGHDDRDYSDTRIGHGVMYRYILLVELKMYRVE